MTDLVFVFAIMAILYLGTGVMWAIFNMQMYYKLHRDNKRPKFKWLFDFLVPIISIHNHIRKLGDIKMSYVTEIEKETQKYFEAIEGLECYHCSMPLGFYYFSGEIDGEMREFCTPECYSDYILEQNTKKGDIDMSDDSGCDECGGTTEVYIKARIDNKWLKFCHRDCFTDYVKRAKKGGN